jgi:hypothetical protein
MVSGYLPCIEGHDRRRLAALARNLDPASGVAAKRLQEINRSAAKRSNGLVSEDCWVTHQTVEAGSIRTAGVNVGQAPSTIPLLFHGNDLSAFVREKFRTAPGREATLVQKVSVATSSSSGLKQIFPIGEPRPFSVSLSSASVTLLSPERDSSVQITIAPGSSSVPVRLNEEVTSILTRIEVKALTRPGISSAPPRFPWPHLQLDLIVDGVPAPYGCQLSMGYHIENGVHKLILPLTSRGIRNIACVGPDEELIIVIPTSTIEFKLNSAEQSDNAPIDLRLGWRKRLDATYG